MVTMLIRMVGAIPAVSYRARRGVPVSDASPGAAKRFASAFKLLSKNVTERLEGIKVGEIWPNFVMMPA